MRELAKTFEALDTNNNGSLTHDELLVGFTQQMGPAAAQVEVDRIMSSVDMDANGAIDYTEFIAATINKTKLLTKERLKTAFDHFDKNQSGFINLAEIKTLLDQGKKIDDKVWRTMIKEVDINGDGEISYSEFEKMMEQMIK